MSPHPVIARHDGWLALDQEEAGLRAAHTRAEDRLKELVRVETAQQQAYDTAVRSSVASGADLPTGPRPTAGDASRLLAEASGAHHFERRAIGSRRREWMRLNAEHLAGLCRDREADLVREISRLLRGFTARAGEEVRGLGAVAAEAQLLRST